MPVPKHIVQRFGDAWIHPENVAVNGPYTLSKWWSNYLIHLTRNPRFVRELEAKVGGKDAVILLLCRSGNRSAQAAVEVRGRG